MDPPHHRRYEQPVAWIGLQLVELLIALRLVDSVISPTASEPLRWVAFIGTIAAITLVNYTLLKRLRARDRGPNSEHR